MNELYRVALYNLVECNFNWEIFTKYVKKCPDQIEENRNVNLLQDKEVF